MAQLAVSAAGAAIGFAVGGPAGAQFGWLAGSAIGAVAFAPEQDIPKVGDLKAPTVQYGSQLLRLYGSNRTAGTMAWYSSKRVIAGSDGGKGGGDAPTADTAEIDLLYILGVDSDINAVARVWRNGELIWTSRADSSDDSLEASTQTDAWTSISFLDGNPAQLPHAVIEAEEGVGNVPAYRYRQCVLIEGLQLGQSGQIPFMEFEAVTGTVEGAEAETIRYAHLVVEQQYQSVRPEGSIAFGSTSRIVVRAPEVYISATTYTVDAAGVQTEVGTDPIPPHFYFADPGLGTGDHALLVLGSTDTECKFAAVGDGVSFQAILPNLDNYLGSSEIRFGVWQGYLAIGTSLPLDEKAPGSPVSPYNLGNQGRIYIYETLGGSHVQTIEAMLGEIASIAISGTNVWALKAGTVYPFTSVLTSPTAGTSFAAPNVTSIFVSSTGVLCGANATGEIYEYAESAWTLIGTLEYASDPLGNDTAQHGVTGAKLYACQPASYTDESWTYYWRDSFAVYEYTDLKDIYEQVLSDETTTMNADTPPAPRAVSDVISILSPHQPPVIDYAEGDGASWDLDVDFNALFGYDGDTEGNFDDPMEEWVWVAATHRTNRFDRLRDVQTTVTHYVHDFFSKPRISTVDPGTVDLADIVSAEWATVDDVSKIDVSELQGIPVRGFQVAGSIRGAYEALAAVFHFGAVCSDKLYFRLQGGSSSATIAFADLAAGEDGAGDEPFAPERANDDEIPERVILTYPNQLDDYANGTESGNRGSESRIVVAKQSNVVMEPSEAKACAESWAFMLGLANTTATISLSNYYAELEPTDRITVPDADGNLHVMRIARSTYDGRVRHLDLVRDGTVSAFTGSGTTDTGYTPTVDLPATSSAVAQSVLLDIPLLRDVDDDPGFYAVAKGSALGASLYSSLDGTTYTKEVDFTSQAIFGLCSSGLPDWTGRRVFDEVSTLTVNVGSGTLSSSTRAAMLASEAVNACAIGVHGRWELCQFRTATLVSPGIYTLSGFIRGSRGTEWASTGHTGGETFVMLSPTTAQRVEVQTSEVGVSLFYKTVSAGRLLSSVTAEAFTDSSVCQKPFSPVHVRVSRDTSDNATITFQRRTRKSTRFASSSGISAPMGEASQAYEVDIYADGTYVTVVRTLASVTTSASYSAADQTSDGLTPGDTLYMRVYQLNAIVGRGYPAEKAA